MLLRPSVCAVGSGNYCFEGREKERSCGKPGLVLDVGRNMGSKGDVCEELTVRPSM